MPKLGYVPKSLLLRARSKKKKWKKARKKARKMVEKGRLMAWRHGMRVGKKLKLGGHARQLGDGLTRLQAALHGQAPYSGPQAGSRRPPSGKQARKF